MTTQTTTTSSTRTETPALTASRVEAPRDRPFILALTRNGHMSEPVMEYALRVAHRLGYGILAVHVDTMPLAKLEKRSHLFAAAVAESVALLREHADRLGLAVEHLQTAGRIGDLVARLCRARKRIDFVIIDKGIRLEEVTRQSPVPVFPVVNRQQSLFVRTFINKYTHKGVSAMATITSKRHVKHCLLFGSLTAGLYASVFAYQDLVMTWFRSRRPGREPAGRPRPVRPSPSPRSPRVATPGPASSSTPEPPRERPFRPAPPPAGATSTWKGVSPCTAQ